MTGPQAVHELCSLNQRLRARGMLSDRLPSFTVLERHLGHNHEVSVVTRRVVQVSGLTADGQLKVADPSWSAGGLRNEACT